MRLELGENLDRRLVEPLRVAGHDVDLVTGEGLGGADDPQVLSAATAAGRTLVTLDLDFSNTLRYPPDATLGVIVLRPHRATLPQVRRLLESALPELAHRALAGRLFIIEPSRIRVYPAES